MNPTIIDVLNGLIQLLIRLLAALPERLWKGVRRRPRTYKRTAKRAVVAKRKHTKRG